MAADRYDHRFEHDPQIPDREIVLYKEAAHILEEMGVEVLVVDTGNITPSNAAGRIAAVLAEVTGNVIGHG